MLTYAYPAFIEESAPSDFQLRFRDIPEAITGGSTAKAALIEAPDALAAAVEGYLELGRATPDPSPTRPHEHAITLEPALAARVVLARVMTEQKMSKVALAERLGRDEKVVRRMLLGKGATLDLTLAALGTLGVRTALTV